MYTMVKFMKTIAVATATVLMFGCGGSSDAKKIFEFSRSTKDVAVQVLVSLSGTDNGTVDLDLSNQAFDIKAFVESEGEFISVGLDQAGFGLAGNDGVASVPVILTSPTYNFNTIVKVPKSLAAGPDGYNFKFTLEPQSGTSLALASSIISRSLRSFRTNVNVGRPPEENQIPLSLATTMASDIMDTMEITYSQGNFDEVLSSLKSILASADTEVDHAQKHQVGPYIQGMLARAVMLLANDTTKQNALVSIAGKNNDTTSSTFMSRMSDTFADMSKAASAVFIEESTKNSAQIFTKSNSEKIVQAAKNPESKTIYTPQNLSFSDTDTSATIGGTLVITGQDSTFQQPKSYAVYLGGSTKDAMTLVSLGKVEVSSSGITNFIIASGTSVPANATTFWVYPVAEDGTEINAPKLLTLENSTNGSVSVSAPTVSGSISYTNVQSASVTVNWPAATDANTSAANLTYKVVKAISSTAIDTVEEANAIVSGSDLVMDWTAAATSQSVTGLSSGTTYQFAVLVKNSAGKISLYSPVSVTTTAAQDPSSPTMDPSERDVVAVGNRHSCVILSNSDMKCFGQNTDGQLGDGSTTNRTSPVLALSSVAKASAGDSHTCAILIDKTVKCWGSNTSGQIGTGNTTSPQSTPVTVSGVSNVKQLALGQSHTCALQEDGKIYCWGGNTSGQVGDGTNTSRYVPTEVSGISTAKSIDAQRGHTCAVLQDKTVRCWGDGSYGKLGNNTTTSSNVPVDPQASGVSSVSAGNEHSCAVFEDGTAKCWGRNNYGQLGQGNNTSNSSVPAAVTEVASGISFVLSRGERSCFALSAGGIKCMGFGGQGQLGQGASSNSLTAVSVSGITQVAVGMKANQDHTCLKVLSGSFLCWGYNSAGQLGDSTSTTSNAPVTVIGL